MKLLIGVPALDYMHADFVKCLTALIFKLKKDGVNFDLEIATGTLVYFARDRIARKAINEGYTHVLWLDADMVFNPDVVDDLLFPDKPFVCGVFHARRPSYGSCIFKCIDLIQGVSRYEEYPADTFEIAGCGFACVLIETEILKAVCTHYGTCFTPIINYGEDLAFCKRVTELGYKMYCEPSVRVGHIGHKVIWPEDHEKWKAEISNYEEVTK